MAWKGGKPPKSPGRPKGSGRNEFCKEWAARYGLPALAAVAEGKPSKKYRIMREIEGKTRVAAMMYLVDHGIGKAPQAIQHSGETIPALFTVSLGSDTESSDDAE